MGVDIEQLITFERIARGQLFALCAARIGRAGRRGRGGAACA